MRRLKRIDALQFLKEHAALLDAAANPSNPFASSVWLSHYVDQVLNDSQSVVALGADEESEALMLLCSDDVKPSHCTALANYYTSLYSPIATRAIDRRAAVASLVRRCTQATPRISTLKLFPLDADADDTVALADELANEGWYVRRFFCFGNWTLPCNGMTFAEYMAGRESQLRHTFERKSKKLLAVGELDIAMTSDEVDAAMDAYDEVYSRSWKQPEPYRTFVREWARRCAEQGWLRLGIARVNGEPIAAQFWFTANRRAYIFKLAYDEAHAKWSAGTVLTAHMFRHALDIDEVVEIDYLTGDDLYKKSWMTQRRERIGLMACNLRTATGLAHAAAELAGQVTARFRVKALALPA